ncbi:SsrA-binding protein SmpB [Patescibacteria group bacterium]
MPILAKNKKVFHDFEILEKFEAGLKLTGQEVKSARKGNISLRGSYVSIYKGEAWLKKAKIAKYAKAGPLPDYNPEQDRKLLLHKRELSEIAGKMSSGQGQGLTMVPLSVYTRNSLLKVELGLARGKNTADKRQTIRKKEAERDIRRAVRGK